MSHVLMLIFFIIVVRVPELVLGPEGRPGLLSKETARYSSIRNTVAAGRARTGEGSRAGGVDPVRKAGVDVE